MALLSQEPRAAGQGWPGSATNSVGSVGIVTQHSLAPGLENTPWLPQTRSERHSQGLWGISGSEPLVEAALHTSLVPVSVLAWLCTGEHTCGSLENQTFCTF